MNVRLEQHPHRALHAAGRVLFLLLVMLLWYFFAAPMVLAVGLERQAAPCGPDVVFSAVSSDMDRAISDRHLCPRDPLGEAPTIGYSLPAGSAASVFTAAVAAPLATAGGFTQRVP